MNKIFSTAFSDSEEENEYETSEIKKIVKMKKSRKNGKISFLIRWNGCTSDFDSWEEESILKEECPDLIEKFMNEKAGGDKKRGKKRLYSSESENVYEVEKIIGIRKLSNGRNEFKIRWKNYSRNDDSWENESCLNCPQALKHFYMKAKKAAAREMVEKILDITGSENNSLFLVRWKNMKDDSWEDEIMLMNCHDLLEAFFGNNSKL